MHKISALILPVLLALTLGACGGGGGGGEPVAGGPNPPPPPGSPPPPPPPAPPEPPIPDRFEPNDSAGAATGLAVPADESGLTIDSSTDEDFFRFELQDTADVRVTVRFFHNDGDIDIELLDDAGTPIGASNSSGDDEEVTSFGLDAGAYSVRVYGNQGAMSPEYAIFILSVSSAAPEELFGDVMVYDLSDPRVFGSGLDQTLALNSELLNLGTAPAPGDDLGNGTADFRLLDEIGAVVASGTKGPIFFTDNGGCDARRDIFDDWLAAGSPHIPGTAGAPSLTSPGCIDFYDSATNNDLDTPLNIGDPAIVPDGDYFYELEFDAPNVYEFEPDFARANNSGAVPISISTVGDDRVVSVTGPIVRSGELNVDSGTMDTVIGNGAALAGLGATYGNDSGVERTWGVARDAAGQLFFTLWDDGSFCRDNGDGTSTKIINNLNLPMVFDFFTNDDVVIADFGNDRILLATAAANYSDAQEIVFPGFAISSPTAARVGPDGLVYVSNSGNHEILRLDLSTGAAERVAGNGVQGFSGDGGAADQAQLSYPIDLDVTDEGLMVIADGHNNRLRIVNLSDSQILSMAGIGLVPGQIKTLAGAGPTSTAGSLFDNQTDGFRGNRQHALSAIMDWPFAPRIVGERVYFVDADNHRLRLIDEFGTIHVLAGNTPLPAGNGLVSLGSENDDVGDGNSGLDATLNRVMDINVFGGPDSAISIDVGDTDNYRIRRQSDVELAVTPYP